MSVVKHLTIWTCAAECCGLQKTQEYNESAFTAMDRGCERRRPCPPDGWHYVEGETYCGGHSVEVTAVIRTPTTVVLRAFAQGDARRVFIGGDLVETKRLMRAA